jgi:hypothetical protein
MWLSSLERRKALGLGVNQQSDSNVPLRSPSDDQPTSPRLDFYKHAPAIVTAVHGATTLQVVPDPHPRPSSRN